MVEIIKQNYHENKIKFNKIKKELNRILDNKCIINHVGSTAIPRMIGKNIIDILIGVSNTSELESVTNILVKNGYYLGKNNTKRYRFLASRKEETKSGDIHLHLAIINGKRYNDFLFLRDYLLDNSGICKEYVKVKEDIVSKNNANREKYRKIKASYVKKMIQEARNYHRNCFPKVLVLIRHGENISDYKLDNNLLPLSDRGKKQALNVKNVLSDSFNIVISSPSLRCQETASIIGNNIPCIVDERLLEKGYGNKKYDGNETIFEATNRFTDFLRNLRKYQNQNVLVVTHGSLIRLAQNIIEERNIRRNHINNCSFVRYEKD